MERWKHKTITYCILVAGLFGLLSFAAVQVKRRFVYDEHAVTRIFANNATDEGYKTGARVIYRNWRCADGEYALHFYGSVFMGMGNDGRWIEMLIQCAPDGMNLVSNSLVRGPASCADLKLADENAVKKQAVKIERSIEQCSLISQTSKNDLVNSLRHGISSAGMQNTNILLYRR